MGLKFDGRRIGIMIFGIVWICGAIGGLIHYQRMDNRLKNTKQLSQVESDLLKEIKKIELPPKTGINKTESSSKTLVYARATARYRTELNQNEFIEAMKIQLQKNGWIYYGSGNQSDFAKTFNFCKGKFDSQLSLENRNLWDDSADYFQLSFSFGQRNFLDSSQPLPTVCR